MIGFESKHITGKHYVSIDNGVVTAGYTKEDAQLFDSIQDAYGHYYNLYAETGHNGAWNIAYVLQDYLGDKK